MAELIPADAADIIAAVGCPVCHAEVGNHCRNSTTGRHRPPHPERTRAARELERERRLARCHVYYRCPVCGQGHSRAQHEAMTS